MQHAFLAGIRVLEDTDSHDNFDDAVKDLAVYTLKSLRSVTWDRARQATVSDENMHLLTSIIESGMPRFRHELPAPLRAFHQHLHTINGVIVYKDQIVIPPSLRRDILSAPILHTNVYPP